MRRLERVKTLQNAHRETAVGAAGDLGAPRMVVLVWHADRLVRAERAPREGEPGRCGANRRADRILDREAQDLLALQEERPLLLVESLVSGQIDDRGVRLDLAEVGVHRGVECEVGGETDLRVESDRARAVRAAAGRRRAGAGLPEHVRQQLDVARGAAGRGCRGARRAGACARCSGGG